MVPPDCPAKPWLSFLTELDAQLDAPVDFHCIGGFVVSQHSTCWPPSRRPASNPV
jgi:hypothetical protein